MPSRPKYDAAQVDKIRTAVSIGHTSWDDKVLLKDIKKIIKDFHIKTTDERCCYCGANTHNVHRGTLDIEHILPKSLFPYYMFTTKNLSISCKRCNLTIKKAKVDFLSEEFNRNHIFRTRYYKFIHPNLDNYDAHLLLEMAQSGRKTLIKYRVVNDSSKGHYTYSYFKLDALEKDSFDQAQGASTRHEINNPAINAIFEALQ